MGGFNWSVSWRMTPDNGPAETLAWDSATLQDLRRPVKIGLKYERESEERENILRESVPLELGARPEITFILDISTMVDQANVVKLYNRLRDPRWKVELSLNGGTTYREVVLAGDLTMTPIGGKWISGTRIEMRVRAVELIDDIPAVTSVDGSGMTQVW